MKSLRYFDEHHKKYFFRVSKEQYYQLVENYFKSIDLAQKQIKTLAYTYDEYHTSNMKIKPEKMNYGTKIDIHVVGQHDGKDYYIPAVVGDVKEHSTPDGLYQTGVPFDSKRITVEGYGSTVEFMGYGITEFVDPKDGISKTTINYTNEFKLIELIIYDGTNK